MRPNLFVPSYVWTNHANFDNAASAVTERGRGRGGPPLAAIRKGRQNGVKFKKNDIFKFVVIRVCLRSLVPVFNCCLWHLNYFMKATLNNLYYIEKLHTVYLLCISRCSKTAKIKLFINYKREMYAPAHLNRSTASFKCLS